MKFIEDIQNLLLGGGIQIAGWLVRQQHERLIDQGSRHGHPLLLPAGKLHGSMV